MYEHREADRVPITETPWGTTVERWRREGLPEDASVGEFFELDGARGFGVDNSPRYEPKVLEETDEYCITTSAWGATMKNWKHTGSTPDFLDFTITDRDSWAAARERIQPDDDRLDWAKLEQNYDKWVAEGAWITAGGWFGYTTSSRAGRSGPSGC
jgi:uroporphyrinogen decarboxylase